MTAPDRLPQIEHVEQWTYHAREDARAACACLAFGPPVLGSAAYHRQQAAEKLLKGALVLAGVDFRKTHNLAWLGNLVADAFPDLRVFIVNVTELTSWAIAYRYPAEAEPDPEPSVTEIGEALEAIAALREAVQRLVRKTRDGNITA